MFTCLVQEFHSYNDTNNTQSKANDVNEDDFKDKSKSQH